MESLPVVEPPQFSADLPKTYMAPVVEESLPQQHEPHQQVSNEATTYQFRMSYGSYL